MHAWELHPALVHFPIAFLIAAVALDLYTAYYRDRPGLAPVATGLLVTGTVTGILAAAAGLVAFYTVPAHTEEAHAFMLWHLGLNVAALAVFVGLCVARWPLRPPSELVRWLGVFAVGLLCFSSWIGGEIVYHGGAGIDPGILSPQVVEGPQHHHEP
ncbi:MAG TPA: DUF2231 domain-containing protein [Planctomycetota bacterium]|nr:DUF2231 domain-containing protein [Planctomycetota bacterium]